MDMEQATLLEGMEPMEALSLMSDTDESYRIIVDCGRAEAAQRQKRAGEGEVTDRGYERVVSHELFAELAEDDPDAMAKAI